MTTHARDVHVNLGQLNERYMPPFDEGAFRVVKVCVRVAGLWGYLLVYHTEDNWRDGVLSAVCDKIKVESRPDTHDGWVGYTNKDADQDMTGRFYVPLHPDEWGWSERGTYVERAFHGPPDVDRFVQREINICDHQEVVT